VVLRVTNNRVHNTLGLPRLLFEVVAFWVGGMLRLFLLVCASLVWVAFCAQLVPEWAKIVA
jgi:hypothetical protein